MLLEQTVTIAVGDRKILGCFAEAGITAGYVWNSLILMIFILFVAFQLSNES